VNAGGDIATRGGSWPVGVSTGDGTLTLELTAGSALATSGRDRRAWRRAGRALHHLIDPSTGGASASDVVRITVVAADAVDAEVLATAFFLAGMDEGAAAADAAGVPTVIVGEHGRTLLAGGLA
jgi:thiamine biosynthesis lipoprotein